MFNAIFIYVIFNPCHFLSVTILFIHTSGVNFCVGCQLIFPEKAVEIS